MIQEKKQNPSSIFNTTSYTKTLLYSALLDSTLRYATRRLEALDNRRCEIGSRRVSSHISSLVARVDSIIRSSRDRVGNLIKIKMSQHHGSTQNHRSRVRLIRSHNITGNVASTGLEKRVFATDVATGHNTGSTGEGGADIGYDSAVEVGHDHYVELCRFGDELHRGVVDDRVAKFDAGALVFLGNLAEGVEEKTITELHDVGFVHASDFLPSILQSKVKREPRDPLSLSTGGDLQALNDTGEALVPETRVLTPAFSRVMDKSTLKWLVGMPRRDLQKTTEA